MTERLDGIFRRDRQVWDTCAETYEERIVSGHPDVTAYEEFEEDLIDRILFFLVRDRGLRVALYDVGCGSARLHQRYGMKIADPGKLPEQDARRVVRMRRGRSRFAHEQWLETGLARIGGMDFSRQMIALARGKIVESGLESLLGERLFLEEGSAFELEPFEAEPVPLLVSVCNSIGVMQGPLGAVELFKSMRRAVERAGGIALISAYRGEAVESHALGNYESTLDVCGMPRWLEPARLARPGTVLRARHYKRAHDPSPTVSIDILDQAGELLQAEVTLARDPGAVARTIESCHIRTHTDYESHWYPFSRFSKWLEELWAGIPAYHLAGCELDRLRAAPVQLAVLDPYQRLAPFFARLNAVRTATGEGGGT